MWTIAHQKLAAAVAVTNASDVARKSNVQANTIRLLCLGAADPRQATMAKLTKLGISPSDWFVIASGDLSNSSSTASTAAPSSNMALASSTSTPSSVSNG
jgi:hypothetical protein